MSLGGGMERCELARGLLVFIVSFIILFDFLNYVHALLDLEKN